MTGRKRANSFWDPSSFQKAPAAHGSKEKDFEISFDWAFVAVRVSFNIVRFRHINRKRRWPSCQPGFFSLWLILSSDHREICKNQLNMSPRVLIIITDTDTIWKFSWMRFPVPVQITVWNSSWLWLWLPFICGSNVGWELGQPKYLYLWLCIRFVFVRLAEL